MFDSSSIEFLVARDYNRPYWIKEFAIYQNSHPNDLYSNITKKRVFLNSADLSSNMEHAPKNMTRSKTAKHQSNELDNNKLDKK